MAQSTSGGPVAAVVEASLRQLIMLTFMFVLGMAVNLLGLPSEAEGTALVLTDISLGLHAFVALGLSVGAVLIVVRTTKAGMFTKKAWAGLAIIALTVVSGVLTLSTESDWWSYAMALGFIAALWVYGSIYVKARAAK